MSSVLDRPGLEKSPLADLHLLASELGVENFRRLRKADLIDAILDRQGGVDTGSDGAETEADTEAEAEAVEAPEAEEKPRPRRGRRGGRSRSRRDGDEDEGGDDELEEKPRGRSRDRDRDGNGDIYISAAQVKRCELVSGDRVGGPVRAPR